MFFHSGSCSNVAYTTLLSDTVTCFCLQNWRRRKFCMRCCPFAEGNANIHPSMLANMAAAQNPLYASMAAGNLPVYPVYATPPRHTALRGHALLEHELQPSGPHIQPNLPHDYPACTPMKAGPVSTYVPPVLQSPFGPMLPTHNSGPVYGQVVDFQQDPSVSASGQPRNDDSQRAAFLYDSGYGRHPHAQDTQIPA